MKKNSPFDRREKSNEVDGNDSASDSVAPARHPRPAQAPVFRDNEDFYEEDGLIVFTRQFHLKRGYCCKSSSQGCRHCPYR